MSAFTSKGFLMPRARKYVRDPVTRKLIDGLSVHKKSGRYYSLEEDGTRVYFGTNLPLAIFRFRQWQAERSGDVTSAINFKTAVAAQDYVKALETIEDLRESPDARIRGLVEFVDRQIEQIVYHDPHALDIAREIASNPEASDIVIDEGTNAVLWGRIREMLLTNPARFEERTGLKVQVIDAPDTSPTLKRIGDLYQDKVDILDKTKQKAETWWKEFKKGVAPAKTVGEVTVDHVRNYRDTMLAKGYAPKTIAHRFQAVRTLLRNAQVEGHSCPELTQLLDHCQMLKPPRQSGGGNPHPIDRKDLHKLLAKADTVDSALILIGLNCAMLAKELSALDQADVDLDKGVVATRRRKKGQVVRAAVLWERTIQALREYLEAFPHDTAALFIGRTMRRWKGKTMPTGGGGRMSEHTIRNRFKRLREKAAVDDNVKFEDLRDGAQTSAVEGGADPLQADVLLGHQTGIRDRYLQRNPWYVKNACEAVEKTYFGPEEKTGEEDDGKA